MGKKQVDVFATEGLNLNLSGSADGRDGRDGPCRLSKGRSWTWRTRVRTQMSGSRSRRRRTWTQIVGPGPASEWTGPGVRTWSGPGPDLTPVVLKKPFKMSLRTYYLDKY